MSPDREWPAYFHKAITSLGARLDRAMWAEGSREGWLQTEVMLHGRRQAPKVYIYPNFEPIQRGSKRKFDFAVYESDAKSAPLLAVAELKIMAGHFGSAWKCLTGGKSWSNWKDPRDGTRRKITRNEIMSCDANWGLVPDARRLLEFRKWQKNEIGTYLILVLLSLSRDAGPEACRAHKAMDAAQFGDAEYPQETDHQTTFKVKVWTLS